MVLTQNVKDGIQELIQKAEKGSLAGATRSLCSFLKSNELAWVQRLHPNQVGVHPQNRDGSGLSASHVQSLVAEFWELGYDPSLTRNICLELPPGSNAVQEFNASLARGSEGKLPLPSTVRYASVSGSHTNQCMLSWYHGMPHNDERLTNGNRLSLEKLRFHDPVYYEHATQGMEWTAPLRIFDFESFTYLTWLL